MNDALQKVPRKHGRTEIQVYKIHKDMYASNTNLI